MIPDKIPTMRKLINIAVKDGHITPNEMSAAYIMDAAKEVAAKWDQLKPEEKKVFRNKYYTIFLKKIGKKNGVNESFDEYSNDALADMIINLSRYEGNEEDIQTVKKELNKRKGIAEGSNKIKGGLADNKSVDDIAKKHKVSADIINKAIAKGVKVEKEHTSDADVAYEIAKDHIFEDPKYYEKLTKMEKTNESLKPMIQKMLREQTELKITDETPESINILVEYNGRNAGIIVVAPANTEKTIEIVDIKFKKDYETIYIINEAVKSLWGTFKEINSLIVAPKPEGIAFWNKLGFTRISPNYLILHRGH